MLARKQDLAVLTLYYLGYSRIRNLVFRLQGKRIARFPAFHDISSEAEASFREKLRFLKGHTNVVSLDDYFAGNLSSKRINVVITFDDGYKSWISTAVPALKQLGLTATFFLSSGFLGLSRDAEAEFVRSNLKTSLKTTGGLSEEDVRSMADAGFTIGGHTRNHANLAEMNDRSEARLEILEDKRRLESLIGRTVHYFAYPFGAHYNPTIGVIDLLQEAGYRGAVATVPGFNTPNENRYVLKRELTGAAMPISVFKARICGDYDGVSFLKGLAGMPSEPARNPPPGTRLER